MSKNCKKRRGYRSGRQIVVDRHSEGDGPAYQRCRFLDKQQEHLT